MNQDGVLPVELSLESGKDSGAHAGSATLAPVRLTARALNRATLGRQLLLRRESYGVLDGLRRVVALQAQHPGSPYVALWNRLAGFDPAELDAAFTSYAVVKSNMVRMTLHAVRAEDYRAFREALEPSLRAAKLDSRFTASGLTQADASALTPKLLAFVDEPRTGVECEAWLEKQVGSSLEPRAWAGLRQYAPMLRAPTGDSWTFGPRTSYVAPRPRPRLTDDDASAEGLKTLLLRYLAGFGPASVADVAQFALVRRARTKAAVEELAGKLVRVEGPSGEALYDLPDAPLPDEDSPAPARLMAMWDSVLLAYADRSRVIPHNYRKHVIRSNGDVLPTLLVDGYVAGVWRPADGGIEATAFHPLGKVAWNELRAEATTLLPLLADREPRLYGRYGRWWPDLPTSEVRLLSA